MFVHDEEVRMMGSERLHALHGDADAERVMRCARQRPAALLLRAFGSYLIELADRIAREEASVRSTTRDGLKAAVTRC